jgi:hypothetical protein
MVRDLRRSLWLALPPKAPARLPLAFRPMRLPALPLAPTGATRRTEYPEIDAFGQPAGAVCVRPNHASATEHLVSGGEALESSFRPTRNGDIYGVNLLDTTALVLRRPPRIPSRRPVLAGRRGRPC